MPAVSTWKTWHLPGERYLSECTEKWFDEFDVEELDWSAWSPDLNLVLKTFGRNYNAGYHPSSMTS